MAAKRAGGAAAGPRKRVVKKVARPPAPKFEAAEPEGEEPEPRGEEDGTPRRSGQMKFTAHAPASDQIVARRIQSKEQLVLLSDARQGAALRALSSLGISQPELVGVGARSLDARSAPQTGPLAPTTAPTEEPPSAPPVTPPEPEITTARAGPVARAQPAVATPAQPSTTPPAGAPTPAPEPMPPTQEAPPAVKPPPVAPPPVASPPVEPLPVPVGESDAAPAEPDAAGDDGPITPHQPLRGPTPLAAPMGTDVPFMEVKGSALGSDLDRIGERILIFADRVELRDRSNAVRQTIHYDQLDEVEVQKKLMGPTLTVTSALGASISVKALRSPEFASGAKAMIDKHAARFREGGGPGDKAAPDLSTPVPSASPRAPAPPETVTAPSPPLTLPEDPSPVTSGWKGGAQGAGTHHTVLIAMLEELHDSGILSDDELESKRALIERGPAT